MRVKLMTFQYSATLGGFDDEPLPEFTRDKGVIAFRHHSYTVDVVPHLSCRVQYQDALVPREVRMDSGQIEASAPRSTLRPTSPRMERNGQAPDSTGGLDEAHRVRFNHLRQGRSRTAHADGVPPYVVLTNRQLFAIVRQSPDTPTAPGTSRGSAAAR